jgi:GNAT superfamily N-acetyltransferase
MQLGIHPLTPERWLDLMAIFESRGCSVAKSCGCMAYRRVGAVQPLPGLTHSQTNRANFKAVVDTGPPPGLLAYRAADGQPVGWLSVGPRADYQRLARSPIMKPVDELPVWSVICFVVPAEFRRQGIARQLLAAAAPFAASRGATWLEAYPVDTPGEARDDALWFGSKALYDAAGYAEVARRKPTRPVVRIAVAPAGNE